MFTRRVHDDACPAAVALALGVFFTAFPTCRRTRSVMYVTPRRKIPATVFVASRPTSETKKRRPSEGVKAEKADARAKAASNQRRDTVYFLCGFSVVCWCFKISLLEFSSSGFSVYLPILYCTSLVRNSYNCTILRWCCCPLSAMTASRWNVNASCFRVVFAQPSGSGFLSNSAFFIILLRMRLLTCSDDCASEHHVFRRNCRRQLQQ